jgi:hypothetical protein
VTPETLPAVITTAVVVLVLVLGLLRLRAAYRKVRRTLRRWGHTRLVLAQVTHRRKGNRRRG